MLILDGTMFAQGPDVLSQYWIIEFNISSQSVKISSHMYYAWHNNRH
jgi:hypothetical protein